MIHPVQTPGCVNPLWRRAHVLVCLAVLAIVAVPKAQPRDTDADLRAAVNEFVDIWNRHDMTQFGDAFTPDAHFVNVIAVYLDGRAAILDHHAPSHQSGWMRQSTMSGEIRRVQFLSPTLGVVHLHWTSHMDGWLGRLRPRSGGMTLVLRHDSDRWRIVSAQNTDAGPPVGAPGDWLMLALIGGGRERASPPCAACDRAALSSARSAGCSCWRHLSRCLPGTRRWLAASWVSGFSAPRLVSWWR